MPKSKHNTTKRGTHRQRVFQFRQEILAARKAASETEKNGPVGDPNQIEVLPPVEASNG